MVWNQRIFLVVMAGLVFWLSGCEEKPTQDTIHFERKSLAEVRKFEQKVGSQLYPGYDHGKVIKAFLPELMETQWEKSLFYYREQSTGMPLRVKYYFDPSTPDSTVQLVTYEWNVIGPDLSENEIVDMTAKLGSFDGTYKAKYNTLAQSLVTTLGPQRQGDPKIKSGELNLVKQEYNQLAWQTGNTVVELELRIAAGLSSRIFLKVYWTDKTLPSDQHENQITF